MPSFFVFAVYKESHPGGTLHIEGVTLDVACIGFLHYLILANPGKRHSVRKVIMCRCNIGKAPTNGDSFSTPLGISTTALQLLILLLQNLPALVDLDLSSNYLDNNAFNQILTCLSAHDITDLTLEDNLLQGEEGGRLVHQFLASCRTLGCLNNAKNPLGSKGALEVAAGLAQHGNSEDLDIACCEIARADGDTWSSEGKCALRS